MQHVCNQVIWYVDNRGSLPVPPEPVARCRHSALEGASERRKMTLPERRDYLVVEASFQEIYWRLADRVAEGHQVKQCRCEAYFFPEDARQRFCPPPPGMNESRCGRRYRMRACGSVRDAATAIRRACRSTFRKARRDVDVVVAPTGKRPGQKRLHQQAR